MAEEFVHVRMSGDSSSIPGRVTRAAYDQIWKDRGFVIVDEDEAMMASSPETLAEMENREVDAAAKSSTSTRKKG